MKMTDLQKFQQNAGSRFARLMRSYSYNPERKPPSRRDLRRLRGKENKRQHAVRNYARKSPALGVDS